MTAQEVVNNVSQDIRSQLSASGADAAILLTYVDRVHKDVLHTSVYAPLVHSLTTIGTSSGTASYTLSPTDIRQVLMVYDRTRNRELFPMAPDIPWDFTRLRTSSALPEFWKHSGTTIYLFPTPKQTLTLEIHYAQRVTTVSALGTTLTVPDDALDLIVAGVNALASQFLKNDRGAQFWLTIYQSLKDGQPRELPKLEASSK